MINGVSCESASGNEFGAWPAKKVGKGKSVPLLAALFLLCLTCTLPLGVSAATKVAFIADTGASSGFTQVLSLIREEGADLVLVQGDLGYDDNSATEWEAKLTAELGRDFPALAVVGNHENFEWPLYKNFIRQRIKRAGLSCTGDVGVKANCTFENLRVVQVAQGIREVPGVKHDDSYDDFIRSSFAEVDKRWRICTWHKNQTAMQVYSKSNSTGWDIYDACLDAGAMIAMGHAHTSSRTHLMTDYRTQTVAHRSSNMVLRPGQSFAVVSGLGGRDVRPQKNNGDWFASVYTSTQNATHGALFCTFDDVTAGCYFKAVNGAVPDRFTLRRGTDANGNNIPALSRHIPSAAGVFRRTDKNEFWWIAQNSQGQWSRRFISNNCAADLNLPRYSGDWDKLISLVPVVGNIPSPCTSRTIVEQGDKTPSPEKEAIPTGYVFSRTDTDEFRWIDTNAVGQIGSIWIDQECAARLGGGNEPVTGDWITLNELAPGFDTLRSPCGLHGGTPRRTPAGYVYSRTDKQELRWIDVDETGQLGNIWIDQACADSLGGVTASGDWFDLIEEAPGFDAIPSPCY